MAELLRSRGLAGQTEANGEQAPEPRKQEGDEV